MPEVHIGRRFLKGGCYFQQITTDVAEESLIPYNLT